MSLFGRRWRSFNVPRHEDSPMNQQCPKCLRSVKVDEGIAEKPAFCQRCGEALIIQPPIQNATSPQVDIGSSKKLDLNTIVPAKVSSFVKKNKISTSLAFCMLGATIVYLVAIFGMILFSSYSAVMDAQIEESNSVDIGGGGSIVFGPNGVVKKSARIKEAESAGQFLGVFVGSICCPGVPYVLVMLCLGIAYFAFRSAGN